MRATIYYAALPASVDDVSRCKTHMPGPKFIHPEALAKAKLLYEETNLPVADIAAMLDVNETTLYRRGVRLGWKTRSRHRTQSTPNEVLKKHGATPIEETSTSMEAAPLAPAEDGGAGDLPFADSDLEALAARVEEAANRQAIQVERMLRLGGSAEAETRRVERAARTLASLAQTLTTLRRARKLNKTSEVAEDAILSDADIRREIAAALERIAAGDNPAAAIDPEPSGG